MRVRSFGHCLVASLLFASSATAVALTITQEVEPNNTRATATVLPLNGGRAIGRGAITGGDADWWRLDNIPANAKIWVYIDTGGTQNAGANSRDTAFSVLAADGGTILESDDDDAVGNGLDGSIESVNASAIAGLTLAAGGTYYLEMSGIVPSNIIDPYHLYVVVTRTNVGAVEVEPNNAAVLADRIVTGRSLYGVRTGTISPAGDLDFVSIEARAGDIVLMVADGDPARSGGTGTNAVLRFYDKNGTTVLLTCDGGGSGGAGNPAGEACAYKVSSSGTYFASIAHATAAATGAYAWMVANMTRPVLDAVNEVEPNNSPATATLLPMNGGRGMATGVITPGDEDWWRIELNIPGPGAIVWAYVDTGGVQNPGADSRDSVLTIYASDGTTVLGFDNDNGTGNGLDGTVEIGFASATSTSLLTNGTYYLKVKAFSPADTINPYRVFVASAPQLHGFAENEPNNTPAFSNLISSPADLINYTASQINAPGDLDYYRVRAGAGDVILMMVDSDFGHTGSGEDVVIEFYDTDGTTRLLKCDSAVTGSPADVTVESCAYQVGVEGDYYVAVRDFSATASGANYHLLVANMTPVVNQGLPAKDESAGNNVPATATPLPLNGGRGIGEGSIAPVGDIDWWRIDGIAPNSRIWAYVDTGGAAFGNSRDSILTLYAGNGSTVIETDDDDGSGNGLDGTVESAEASAIAGRVLAAGGSYYLSINEFNNDATISPYRLYVVVSTPADEAPEVAPDNSIAQANPISLPGNPVGVRNGAIAVLGQQDYYSVAVDAGDIIVMSTDNDPARSGPGLNLSIELFNPDGFTVALTCDSSGVSTLNPAGEACAYQTLQTGTWYVRVQVVGGGATGGYSLMVANMNNRVTLDVDASEPATVYDALTDGVLVMRYLFGMNGSALTNSAMGPTATRTAAEILTYLDQFRMTFDVDGDGNVDSATDGLLIMRYLLGLRGADLINNAVAPGAPRATAPLIESYIQLLIP